ncbi:MAG: hypothetical protein M0T74_08355 [Desulfitobacterium hafniense]|nr:hypothetical protein [Desulfitobacterium hafniense]
MNNNRERGTPIQSGIETTYQEFRDDRKETKKSLVEQIVERVDSYMPKL